MSQTILSNHRIAATEAIRAGSLSFALAARLLGPAERDAIYYLYAWCRHMDDITDEGATDSAAESWIHQAFAEVVSRYQIPSYYPEQLLAGMAMDRNATTYQSLEELKVYAYRVAGTVGLMCCHIFGIRSDAALEHARDLGVAMQLTNIARDVRTDFLKGRIYLPRDSMKRHGLAPDDLLAIHQRAALVRVVEELLAEADRGYFSAMAGLAYLPKRAAFAVAAAAGMYQAIGRHVRQAGANAWEERQWVPLREKLIIVAHALTKVIHLAWGRQPMPVQRRFQRILRVYGES